jgi:hypothetical protein
MPICRTRKRGVVKSPPAANLPEISAQFPLSRGKSGCAIPRRAQRRISRAVEAAQSDGIPQLSGTFLPLIRSLWVAIKALRLHPKVARGPSAHIVSIFCL